MSLILELENRINNLVFEIELIIFEYCLKVEVLVEFFLEWLKVVEEWGIGWEFY